MAAFTGYRYLKSLKPQPKDALLRRGRLESAINKGWDGIKTKSEEILQKSGAGELENLVKLGLVEVRPLAVSDDSADIVHAYLDVITDALDKGNSYPLLDDQSSNLIRAMAREGRLMAGEGAIHRGKAIGLAADLFERLPTFEEASVADVLDVRSELQDSLVSFRSAMLEYTESIKSAAWDESFPSDADNVFMQKVAPTIEDIDEAVRSNKYLIELTSRIGDKPAAILISALGLLLAEASSTPGLISAALGVGSGTAYAAWDAHLEHMKNRREYEQNHLYFYYGSTKRLGRPL